MTAPVISVVIAAYNAAEFIGETLDSIRAQTFRHFEVIVVDDGSTDRTRAIVDSYPEVRCISQARAGQPAARNLGIRAARGQYVALVDADDLWLPEKLERQAALLARDAELAWAYCDAYVFESETGRVISQVGKQGRLLQGDIATALILENFIPSATPIVRRDVFEKVGYFDEAPLLRYGEDWHMWLRVALQYPVGLVEAPLAKVRRHKTSMVGSMDPWDYFHSTLFIVNQIIASAPAKLADARIAATAMVCRRAGVHMLLRGRVREARKLTTMALALAPRNWRTVRACLCAFLPPPVFACLLRTRRAVRGRNDAASPVPVAARFAEQLER